MAGEFGEAPLGLWSQILSVAAVLTRKAALKVPRYQRPYTWTEREVRILIQDLRRAFERDAVFYFIGQIVLVKNRGKLEISDGQQRLTTLTMIMAYVRDRLPGRGAERVDQLEAAGGADGHVTAGARHRDQPRPGSQHAERHGRDDRPRGASPQWDRGRLR